MRPLPATSTRYSRPLRKLRAGVLVIGTDPLFKSGSEQARYAGDPLCDADDLPMSCIRGGGGLLSYGGSATEPFRQVGMHTGRVLKGEKPAELPIEKSTKVALIINLKTAKALGLNVPTPIIGRADEVIE